MDSTSTPIGENNTQVGDEDCFQTPQSKCGDKRKDMSGGSGATSQPTKPRRILPTRSPVWASFTRTKENRDRCVCNHCQNTFSCVTKSGTSNLQKHLLICKEHLAWLDGQNEKQPIINAEGGTKTAKVSEQVFREATNEMLVLGELALAFIEEFLLKKQRDA